MKDCKVHRFVVRNYKCLKDVELRLHDWLTVVVGPNGSGKTSLWEAFRLLRNAADRRTDPIHRIHMKGFAFVDCVFNRERGLEITLELQFTAGAKPPRLFLYRQRHFAEDSIGGWRIAEEISVHKEPKGEVIEKLATESFLRAGFQKYKGGRDEIEIILQNIGAYRLRVDEMKKEVQPRRRLRLRHDGSNLAQVLQTLKNEYSERFNEIVKHLCAASGQIKNVILRLDDMRDALHIRFAENWTDKSFAVWAMGEGLLHFLALVTLMNVPKPPHLVVIDEIENHLHPHLFKLLLEVMEAVHAEHGMQFVVTTQSPTFLNTEGVELEMVRIIERTEDGGARIVAAKDRVEALKTLGVGDAWFQNLLGGTP